MKQALALLTLAAAVSAPAASAASPPATSAAGGVASVLRIAAAPNGLRYTRTHFTARAGRIRILFSNPSSLPHNVRIEQGETELGGTRTVSRSTANAFVKLQPGSYHGYCSVPGHEDAGMQATLTVR